MGLDGAVTLLGKNPQLEKHLPHVNQWLGISDAVTSTLVGGTSDPDLSVDRKFRLLNILNLSNVYETGRVTNNGGIDTPPGRHPIHTLSGD